MPTVNFMDCHGNPRDLEVPEGCTLMEIALENDVAGIVAECGGCCACATCHSYIDEEWVDRLPPIDDMEDAMLDCALERKPNSRLTCQIQMTAELAGLKLQAADNEA